MSSEDLEAVQNRSTGEQLLTQVYQGLNTFLDSFTLIQVFYLKQTPGKVSRSSTIPTLLYHPKASDGSALKASVEAIASPMFPASS